MSRWTVLGVWAGVGFLAVNVFLTAQVLGELQASNQPDSAPTRVLVDWENQELVKVDIASVSNGVEDTIEGGYIPIWTPLVLDSETGERIAVDLPTRVTNQVDVRGSVGVEGNVWVTNDSFDVWVTNF